nr:cuticle protein 7-like [Onthophagus taurus]
MAIKIVILAVFIAVCSAGNVPVAYPAPYHSPYPAPVYSAPVAKVVAPVYSKTVAPEPYDPHPHYSFNYDIHDEHTGDVKSQQEERDGDVVKGFYSFIESDGARRVVEYTSDPEHGFNAVVRREEGAAHPTGPAAAPAYAKVAAPFAKVAAPVYAAPIAKVAAPVYGAPVAKISAPVYAPPIAKVAAPVYVAKAAPVPVAKVAAYPSYTSRGYYH